MTVVIDTFLGFVLRTVHIQFKSRVSDGGGLKFYVVETYFEVTLPLANNAKPGHDVDKYFEVMLSRTYVRLQNTRIIGE